MSTPDHDTREYRAIARFYGDRRARRSGVLLIQHVDEGLAILDALGASERARRAYCLHPLVQGDEDLARTFAGDLREITDDLHVLALALEYRNIANAYLSHRTIDSIDEIALGPLAEVHDMLRADKVQNYKDFLQYHATTHPRAKELDAYFKSWLARLGIDGAEFDRLSAVASALG